MKTYKTLHSFGTDEYIVEKSTFIGYAKPIKSEEEAVEFINEIKKKHKISSPGMPCSEYFSINSLCK